MLSEVVFVCKVRIYRVLPICELELHVLEVVELNHIKV